MKTIVILLLPVFIFLNISLRAQVGINTDGSVPDPTAGLDVKFTDKGFLPPRLTTTQMNAITSPPAGLMVYNTTVNSVFFFDGSSWKMMYNKDGESCGTINYDGQTYQTVIIGTQCWMAENLNIGIAVLGSQNQTNNGVIEKYCYDNSTGNCDTYGGMYQWDEMMQYNTTPGIQGICPTGWHIPTDAEWTTLTDFLGGISVAGGKMKETGTVHWNSPNIGATNESGFTGLPGGYRLYSSGSFYNLGYYGYWWSSSEYPGYNAWNRYLYYNNDDVYRTSSNKGNGFSVRCLKD